MAFFWHKFGTILAFLWRVLLFYRVILLSCNFYFIKGGYYLCPENQEVVEKAWKQKF